MTHAQLSEDSVSPHSRNRKGMGREVEGKGSGDAAATQHAKADTSTSLRDMLVTMTPTELAPWLGSFGDANQEGDHRRARDAQEGRHPIVRTGKRNEIPRHTRSAVWLRDGGRCELCGWARVHQEQAWHLDHIKPWSAGGSDDTTNLRVLCERHNIERSNFVHPFERPRRAATWWCVNCFSIDHRWEWNDEGAPTWCQNHNETYDPLDERMWRCRVVEGMRATHAMTGEWPTWFDRPLIEGYEDEMTIAYCAHCDAPGLTPYPL